MNVPFPHLLAALLLLSGCATVPPPSATPLGRQDLVTGSPEAALSFYRGVFGWTADQKQARYWSLSTADGRPVGGLVALPDHENAAIWLTTLDVENLEETLARVEARGGTLLHGPVAVYGGARTAVIAGPDGARLQLRAPGRAGAAGPWVWHELVTGDPLRTAGWYGEVFGFAPGAPDAGGRVVLHHGGRAVAAVSPNPFEDQPAQWIPVLGVADLDRVLQAVGTHGGQLLQRVDTSGHRIALVADPLQAPLLLQQTGETTP